MSFYDSPYYNQDLTMSQIQPQQSVNQQFQPAPQYYQQPQQNPQPPVQNNPYFNDSNLTTGGFSFTVVKDNQPSPGAILIQEDGSVVENTTKRRRSRPRKSEVVEQSSGIIRGNETDNPPENVPTMYTYQETTDMLRGTLCQIDELAGQVKTELDSVLSSRTLRNKYNIAASLSENLSDIISTKISAIKEINNAISRSNEMDYKREKDIKAAQANVNDDKYIMDLYNAFIQNPMGNSNQNVLGPSGMDATLGSSGLVRASDQPAQSGFAPDSGYLSYVANMTPEQKLMMVDNNPNIKMCVIFDAATGNKAFQYMDMSTGQTVDGLPARDPMFLEDTTIDLKNKLARNINLNETYPVVVINEGVTAEY